MHTTLKKAIILSLGWAFVLLGIFGLFVPVLQGILFLLIGLTILSSEYIWARWLLRKIRNRFPAAAKQMEEASKRATAWLKRMVKRHHSLS